MWLSAGRGRAETGPRLRWLARRLASVAVALGIGLGAPAGFGSLAGRAWAQRDLRDIPPADPRLEQAALEVGEGFEINLFASDPAFAKPIHMNFDAQGRLWVASSRNYPQIEPGAKPSDQIVVLEDRDGDGVAEHHQVFADDLLIPTGILPGDGGVYVANSTELIHLEDRDGDGRADRRRTVLSGFGTEDTHHLLHTLRWAPDGWMMFNQSIYIHSHVETPYGVQHLDGGGIWRFDPHSNRLEVFCKGFVNPWGHAIDGFGQSLATDGAYFEGINYAFPEAVFVTSPGAQRWLSGLNPGSPKHSGLEIISGGAMPAEMQGRLVTNDFRSHRVCLFEIARQGSGYRSVQLPELVRTQHVAFRPIDVKMGGDGAIYIADWYNPIIQHGEVDFRDPRRDTEHGRIWRITAKGHKPLTRPDYAHMNEAALCGLLRDSALWVRQFARMELAARPVESRQAALEKFVQSAEQSEEASLRRLEQLWVELSAREVDAALIKRLLRDADPRIRAVAVRTTARLHDQLPDALAWLSEAAGDADDQVVLEAVTGLGQLKSLPALERLLDVAARPGQDQFLAFALWNAARASEAVWLDALKSGSLKVQDDLAKLRLLADAATQPAVARPLIDLLREGRTAESVTAPIVELAAQKAAPDALSDLLEWLTNAENISSAARTDYLSTLGRVTQSRNVRPDRADALLRTALAQALASDTAQPPSAHDKLADAYRAQLVELAGAWQCGSCDQLIIQWLADLEQAGHAPLAGQALAALARLPQANARRAVRQRATDDQAAPALRAAGLAALNAFDPNAAAELTLNFLARLQASDSAAGDVAAAALVARAGGVDAIRKRLAAIEKLQWTADGARVLIAALRNAPRSDDAFLAEVTAAMKFDALGWKWSDAWGKTIVEAATAHGDPIRGEAIYRQARLQCVRCHSIGQSGGAIGPNLVSLGGSSTPEYIIQSLIDPNAKVKEGFQTLSVLTDDGRVISGLQKSRTDTQLQLVLADGSEQTLAVDAIEAIQNGRSIMPGGLVDNLKESELVDLTRFLMDLGRTPALTVDTAPWVRNWAVLNWSPAANTLLNRTSLDSAASGAPELVWSPLASTVAGRLPLAELPAFQPHRENPPVGFASFEVDCRQPGKIWLELTAPRSAVSTWIDGRPRPTPGADEAIELSDGKHRIVFGLVIPQAGESFGCQVRTDKRPGAAVIELKAGL